MVERSTLMINLMSRLLSIWGPPISDQAQAAAAATTTYANLQHLTSPILEFPSEKATNSDAPSNRTIPDNNRFVSSPTATTR
jgi:hypothetical protein